MRVLTSSIAEEYIRYKALAEAAFRQLPDEDLSRQGPGGSNSIAQLVWHLAGNLASRFTDFRTSDGEKPWRHRDEEFDDRVVTRQQVMEKWEAGWSALQTALLALTDADLSETITIRDHPLTIHQALQRSVTHAAYHVGQIVYLAKAFRGEAWQCLSIPRGGSEAYNRAPSRERPSFHTDALGRITR